MGSGFIRSNRLVRSVSRKNGTLISWWSVVVVVVRLDIVVVEVREV
jgi:hypothetical protein